MGRRGTTFILMLLCMLASSCLVQCFQDEIDLEMEKEKEMAMLKEKEIMLMTNSYSNSNSRSWAKATIVDEDEEDEVVKVRDERDVDVPEEEYNTKQKRKCANDCSMHGSCQADGTCNCYAGYAGADCSIPVTALSSGHPVSHTVLTKEWDYYSAVIQSGQSLKLVVNSTSGDCDLFVQVGHLPTREDYYQRDVSSGAVKNFVMDLKNIQAGQWYIGMFGFSSCAYTLTPTIGSQNTDCPNSCSNAGTCIQGKCHCNAFYGGSDCSMHANVLSANQKFTDSLGAHQWNYYAFNLARENTFAVIINETGNQGDVDVFVKYGGFPNQTYWDYRDISTQHNFALTVATSTRGYYYIGVYGFLATTYQIQVVPYSSCMNYCSKHGQCVESGCRCNGGYSGTVCETMVGELNDGATVSGFVSSDMWNYYHFTANTVNTITVTVNQQVDEAGADCDVYVKRGANPTLTSFDYRNIGTTTNIQLEIPNPQFNTWYIGIYGYATCTYTVNQTASSRCPSTCVAPYGTCTQDGICDCADGWSGDDCQTPVQTLTLGVTYGPDMISTGRWKYFYFNTTSSSIVVHMKEVEDWSIGYYWLFVSEQEFPTLSDHDYSDMNTNTQEHTIRFQTDKDTDDEDEVLEYYVGVYGSPFDMDTGDNHRGTYKLVAWGPPF